MPYIDSNGRIQSRPNPLQRLVGALHSIYLAILLFLQTLFNPNAARRMKPTSSLRDLNRKRREDEGSSRRGGPGGPGGPGGGGRRTGGLNDGSTINFNPNGGGCCGGISNVGARYLNPSPPYNLTHPSALSSGLHPFSHANTTHLPSPHPTLLARSIFAQFRPSPKLEQPPHDSTSSEMSMHS
ncbi:hypothetical protein JCM8547_007948 [Rhodosporidiobolus lusitaniae]